uniref:Uncharacterized protein n=1 Tax=Ascaris lumbricoides TaxID=6252 RepID=A0A9J2PMC6_ASCLU
MSDAASALWSSIVAVGIIERPFVMRFAKAAELEPPRTQYNFRMTTIQDERHRASMRMKGVFSVLAASDSSEGEHVYTHYYTCEQFMLARYEATKHAFGTRSLYALGANANASIHAADTISPDKRRHVVLLESAADKLHERTPLPRHPFTVPHCPLTTAALSPLFIAV